MQTYRPDAETIRATLLNWHAWLMDNRDMLAGIRRCATPGEAMTQPAFIKLLLRLHPGIRSADDINARERTKRDVEALARTALIISGVSELAPSVSVGAAMAANRNGRVAVSLQRARALFESSDEDEACRVLLSLRSLMSPFDPYDLYRCMSNWAAQRNSVSMSYLIASENFGRRLDQAA